MLSLAQEEKVWSLLRFLELQTVVFHKSPNLLVFHLSGFLLTGPCQQKKRSVLGEFTVELTGDPQSIPGFRDPQHVVG